MSDREFEIYLQLLAQMLRLSKRQREAIADELRDHLEQRLEELQARGHSRDDAIQMALDEFGDAAGLAGEFSAIAQRHRLRRHIMQTTLGTLSAAAAIILVVTFLLPENRPGVPPQPAAQAQGADAQADEAMPANVEPLTDRTSQAERAGLIAREPHAVLDKLAEPVSFDFQDAPLHSVFATFREQTGVNLIVNWQAEDTGADAGFLPMTTLTLQLNDLTGLQALQVVAQQIAAQSPATSVDVRIAEAVVTVSGAAGSRGGIVHVPAVSRLYDVRDLLHASGATDAASPAQREAALIRVVNTGSIAVPYDKDIIEMTYAIFDGTLMVQSRPGDHEKVERVLIMLREAREKRDEEAPQAGDEEA